MSFEEESSGEEDIFDVDKRSKVFLGFADDDIDTESKEDTPQLEDSFMGYKPVWLHPDSHLTEEQLSCGNCGKLMALLLQAFAPLENKFYDRIIYVFACINTRLCSRKKGSVKCFRGICKDPVRISKIKSEQEESARKYLEEKLKIDDKHKYNSELAKNIFEGISSVDKPFQSSANNPFNIETNPFKASAQKHEEVEEKKNKPSGNKSTPTYAEVSAKAKSEKTEMKSKPEMPRMDHPSYPGYFVYVEREKFKKEKLEPEFGKYKHLIDSGIEPEVSSSKSTGPFSNNPQASKISEQLSDKYFQAFTDTVQHNPEQVLRYDLGGRPLLYSGKGEVASKLIGSAVPVPAYNPSSARQFELQIMPKAIIDLENTDDKNTTVADVIGGMSWGTIIVYTDIDDYVPDDALDKNHVAYIEEWCGVQWEEL